MGYRILDHTADIGVEVDSATLRDLFREGAAALFTLLTDRAAVNPARVKVIRIDGADLTDLWINYLREILYLFNGEGFLVREVGELTFSRLSGGTGRAGETDRSLVLPEPFAATSLNGSGRTLAAGGFVTAGKVPAAAPAAEDGLAGGDESAGGTAGFLLTACCLGEDYDPARQVIKTEIKAVTYHHAAVRETSAGWQGVFIVDV